jgi:histidine triad (HIT) family protein
MDNSCIFCKIIDKKINADIIYEDDKVLGFKDINPKAPFHILVIPKKHIPSIMDINSSDSEYITAVFDSIKKICGDEKLCKQGFRLIVNNGKNAGQAVGHLHFHIMAGRSMNWPAG